MQEIKTGGPRLMPPPDDYEKRFTTLERTQDKMENTLDQINRTLLRFEQHIDELFEVKTKLDSVDVIWRKIDAMAIAHTAMDKEFHVLKTEHLSCKPKVDTMDHCAMNLENRIKNLETKTESSSAFTNKLFTGLLEKIIWGVIVFGAMSAVYLAGKGAFAR
jgi:uncharacterized coiled-coil protein SlyX